MPNTCPFPEALRRQPHKINNEGREKLTLYVKSREAAAAAAAANTGCLSSQLSRVPNSKEDSGLRVPVWCHPCLIWLVLCFSLFSTESTPGPKKPWGKRPHAEPFVLSMLTKPGCKTGAQLLFWEAPPQLTDLWPSHQLTGNLKLPFRYGMKGSAKRLSQ